MYTGLGVGSTGEVVSYSDKNFGPDVDVDPEFHAVDDSSNGSIDRRRHRPKSLPKWTYQRQTSYMDADLPFNEFGEYLIAILEDDGETIDAVLNKASEKHRYRLMNSKFDFQDQNISRFNKNKHLRMKRPLCVAAISGSLKVLKVFVNHGIDLCTADQGDQFVVHVIISMANYELESEIIFRDTYQSFAALLTVKQRNMILKCENKDGFRPLELAAHLGTLYLFQAIMETDGVYLSRVVHNGLCMYRWYDVTEYECYHRSGLGGVHTAAEAKYDSGGRKLPKPDRAALKALAVGGLGVAGVGRFLNGEPVGCTKERDHMGVMKTGRSINVGGGKSFKSKGRRSSSIEIDVDLVEDRRHLSPLLSLMMLDIKHLNHPNLKQVYFSEPMSAWIESKIRMNRLPIFLWLITRIVHVMVYMSLDINMTLDKMGILNHGNLTRPQITLEDGTMMCEYHLSGFGIPGPHRYFMILYLLIHSSILLFLDLLDFLSSTLNQRKDFYRYLKVFGSFDKTPLSHSRFYERVQRWFVICIIIDTVMKFMRVKGIYPNLVRLLSMLLVPWAILFFVQLLPSIGYFVMAIQRMLRQLYDFGVVFSIFILGFTHAFFVNTNNYARYTCDDTFSSIPQAFYSTFQMMLNIMDPRSLTLVDPTSLFILHIAYTFIVGILLINFLVAIMTSAMSAITDHQPVILVIQRLSVVCSFERRFRIICPFYYEFMVKRKFVVDKNRIYLVRATPLLNYSTRKQQHCPNSGK